MVEKHKHCIVCGMPISPDKTPPVCSKKCEFILNRRARRERIVWMLLPLPFVVLLILFLIFGGAAP